jgi:hypothetical protein
LRKNWRPIWENLEDPVRCGEWCVNKSQSFEAALHEVQFIDKTKGHKAEVQKDDIVEMIGLGKGIRNKYSPWKKTTSFTKSPKIPFNPMLFIHFVVLFMIFVGTSFLWRFIL